MTLFNKNHYILNVDHTNNHNFHMNNSCWYYTAFPIPQQQRKYIRTSKSSVRQTDGQADIAAGGAGYNSPQMKLLMC